MSTRASKKAKTASKADDALAQIVSNLQCPITHRLPVRPVVAADGHVYERSAIEKWLQTKSTSPLTNAEMDRTLMDSTQTRTLIQSAIENGGVDDDAAATWHLESAKLIAAGEMPGAISSVKDHLELADARSSSPEITLSLEAVNLKLQQDALLKRGADAGAGVVASVLGGEKTGFSVMPAWRELRKGKSWVRVIDDPTELERLCLRSAPGANRRACWNPPMANATENFTSSSRIILTSKAIKFQIPTVPIGTSPSTPSPSRRTSSIVDDRRDQARADRSFVSSPPVVRADAARRTRGGRRRPPGRRPWRRGARRRRPRRARTRSCGGRAGRGGRGRTRTRRRRRRGGSGRARSCSP